MELSKQEIEAFNGLEQSYRNMFEKLEADAPVCHFRKMNYETGEAGQYPDWWECSVCGHTKEV